MKTHLRFQSMKTSAWRANKVSLLILLGLGTLAGLLGCAQKTESQEDENEEGYPLLGVVQAVDAERNEMTVAHEEIPGFMEAMTMVFRVRPGDVKTIKPETRIKARLVRDEDGGFRLIKIWPIDEAAAKEMRKVNERLAKQASELDQGYYFGEGDTMPDFALLDQYGEPVTPERLEGKAFMLNFIFTRCNDAKMCPLSTSKMASLQRMAAEKGIEDLEFVSISLDPKYDTPGVLREYADAYGIDGSNFSFVTGERAAVKHLIKSFAVTAIETDDDLMHTLATVLVGPDRKIIKSSMKSAWDPEEFLAAIEEI